MTFIKKFTASFMASVLIWTSGLALASEPAPQLVHFSDIHAETLLGNTAGLRGELSRSLQDEKTLQELTELGVQKSEVELRLAAMTDTELMQIQQGLQRTAGGDVVIISVTTLLIGIIILILLAR